MQIGLESYTFSFSTGMGYTTWQTKHFTPLSALDLLRISRDAGLRGLSVDLGRLLDPTNRDSLISLRKNADEMGLFLSAATGGTDSKKLETCLRAARLLGSPLLRTVVGGAALGGDRRQMKGRWQSFLRRTLSDLQIAAAAAERHKIVLAVENHQDLTSDELLWLMDEISSPYVGILLDVANPLGTAEDPIVYYDKVMPYVKGAHLKDYTIRTTSSGYLLCRCPLGAGVVDFPYLFDCFRQKVPHIRLTVELAALEARHVRVWEQDFWPEYPPRPPWELARTWRFMALHAEGHHDADDMWKTPVESGRGGEALWAYERDQFRESVRYLKAAFPSCFGPNA